MNHLRDKGQPGLCQKVDKGLFSAGSTLTVAMLVGEPLKHWPCAAVEGAVLVSVMRLAAPTNEGL